MKRTFAIALMISAIAFTSFVIDKDPPRYKNLKVLPKNTTEAQMDSLMHHFTAALSVKCNFCHLYDQQTNSMDFVSDAKEQKETARSMWLMTAKLNKKFFGVKDSKNPQTQLVVTCYTCHHGAEHPEDKAPARHITPPPAQSQPAAPVSGSGKMAGDTTHQ